MGQVLFVRFHCSVGIDVIPALKPEEAAQFGGASGQIGEFGLDRRQRLAVLLEHLGVIGARLATGTRWPEIDVQTLAAPAGLDQQHRRLDGIAEAVADLQFRAEVMQVVIDGVADGEGAALEHVIAGAVSHLYIVTSGPTAVLVSQMPHPLRHRRIIEQPEQCPTAAVVVLLVDQIDHRLTLHVRLAGEQVDLDWCLVGRRQRLCRQRLCRQRLCRQRQ